MGPATFIFYTIAALITAITCLSILISRLGKGKEQLEFDFKVLNDYELTYSTTCGDQLANLDVELVRLKLGAAQDQVVGLYRWTVWTLVVVLFKVLGPIALVLCVGIFDGIKRCSEMVVENLDKYYSCKNFANYLIASYKYT